MQDLELDEIAVQDVLVLKRLVKLDRNHPAMCDVTVRGAALVAASPNGLHHACAPSVNTCRTTTPS